MTSNNLSAQNLAEVAGILEEQADKNPTADTTVNFEAFNIGPSSEAKVEEAAAMVRLNGGIIAYTRTASETQIRWNRFRLQASSSLAAWFFREIVEIDRNG